MPRDTVQGAQILDPASQEQDDNLSDLVMFKQQDERVILVDVQLESNNQRTEENDWMALPFHAMLSPTAHPYCPFCSILTKDWLPPFPPLEFNCWLSEHLRQTINKGQKQGHNQSLSKLSYSTKNKTLSCCARLLAYSRLWLCPA